MDFIPQNFVILPLDPTNIFTTFKKIETLLTYTPEQIGDYFALKEALYGINWIHFYLRHMYTQPQHSEAKILDVLQNSSNKPSASYLARIFFTYFTIRHDLLKQHYKGYQQFEQHLSKNQPLLIRANKKYYQFHSV